MNRLQLMKEATKKFAETNGYLVEEVKQEVNLTEKTTKDY